MRNRAFLIILMVFAFASIIGIFILLQAQRVSAQKSIFGDQITTQSQYAINQAELSLNKKGHPQTYDHVGRIITYNYVIKNIGTIPITDTFSVTDDKTSVTCTQPPDGGLSPNEKMNCTGDYTITQADLDAGSLTNIATASGGGVTSNQASVTVNATQTLSLQLTKVANPLAYDHTGQAITYSYVILNNGNVTLTGVFSVTDDKTTATCTQPADGALSPGEAMDCTATYMIIQADLDAGSITNVATASGAGVTSNQASAIVSAVQTRSLVLTKTADPQVYDHVGQPITYSYVIRNTGNVTLTGPFTVTDDKASVTCIQPVDGALAPDETMDCTATYPITQADLNTGSVTNHATASDGVVTSNQDTATVYASLSFSLLLDKVASPQYYDQVGQAISYSYVITNIGNVTLSGPFIVSDDNTTVTCPEIASLAPAAFITCTASYTIIQADLDAGSVSNSATAYGADATSNQATETVTAVQTAALQLNKGAIPMIYDHAGQVISYSYLLTNSGNVTLNAPFTITDNKSIDASCPAIPTSLAPTASITCTGTYTILQSDLDAGHVTNLAMGHGFFGTTPVNSNQGTVTVSANQNSALLLVKSATPATYDHVGQIISYSYVLQNSGNVTLTGPFTVFDDKVINESCPGNPTSLGPGQSITCSASYTILMGDMVSGVVTNNAYATGNFGASAVTSNTATKTVRANITLTYTFIPIINKPYPPGVIVLPVSYYYESHNTMFVIGEVLNNTNDSLTWVNVAVDFINASGTIVGTKSNYLWPLDLPAKVRGCFKISMNVPQNWSYYQFETPTFSFSSTSPGLMILGDSGAYNPGNGDYDIYGQVQNNGNLPSLSVYVTGTLYDSSGKPVGCENVKVNSTNLNPGQTSAFHIPYSGYYYNYSDVTYYKLRVAGDLP